jgi:hypothetical protein
MTDQEEQRPQLRLKNGAMADVRSALIVLGGLRAQQRVRPHVFQTLLALARGKPEEADPEHIEPLTQERYLGPDGKVRQDVADVLLSALQWQGDGAVLVNPFKLEGEADRAVVERTEQQIARGYLDLFPGLRRSGPGPSRG